MNLGCINLHRVDNAINTVAVFGNKHATFVLGLILDSAGDGTDKVSHKALAKCFADGFHCDDLGVQSATICLGSSPHWDVPHLTDASQFFVDVSKAVAQFLGLEPGGGRLQKVSVVHDDHIGIDALLFQLLKCVMIVLVEADFVGYSLMINCPGMCSTAITIESFIDIKFFNSIPVIQES